MNRATSRMAAGVLLMPLLLVIGSSPAHAATPSCHGRVATIVGTAAGEHISGTAGDDVIVGLGGRDTVNGHGGNDFICGNRGLDSIFGGDGADDIHGNGGRDSLDGGQGNDVMSGGSGTYTTFVGDAGDDQWYSRTLQDSMSYDAGVTLDLGAGTATGMGSDGLHLGDGVAWVFLYAASTVLGSDRADVIFGYHGNTTVDAGGGDDGVYLRGQGAAAYGGAATTTWGGRLR